MRRANRVRHPRAIGGWWILVAVAVMTLVGCSEPAPNSATDAGISSAGGSDGAAASAEVAPADAPARVDAASLAVETTAGPSRIEGLWKLSIDTPMGRQHPLLSVRESADGYAVTYTGRQGELLIENLSFDGRRFAFPLTITVPIGQIEVTYEGSISGDQMVGVVQNPRGQVPFSGSRQ